MLVCVCVCCNDLQYRQGTPHLQAWEDREVDRIFEPLAVKDDSGAGSAE
jgi:hypothetical protein